MKKLKNIIVSVVLTTILLLSCGILSGCKDKSKTIKVCASALPHAQILNECVKPILEKQGFILEVKVFAEWQEYNSVLAAGDYDANYFQHLPYLNSYNGKTKLMATCKVHYEPLGIYAGKSKDLALSKGKTFAICNDEPNAVRALKLLTEKGVINKQVEGDNYPIGEDGTSLKLGSSITDTWVSLDGEITIKLISESLLTSALFDNDFACLPCNTALTGNIGSDRRVAVEDDATLISENSNIIAVREDDYKNDDTYKAKIDALTNAMLSEEVANFINEKFSGIIICDTNSQIDLR